jgi:hypothetical protein
MSFCGGEGTLVGIMRGYLCERCPLAFEIGGYVFWSLKGRCEQAVCTACGTMHRLNEANGACEITALPGPVRSLPLVTRKSAWGDGTEITDYEWQFTETDWEAVGNHPGGIEAIERLACARCGQVGRMQSLEWPKRLDGKWLSFSEVCPLCGGPMPWLYDDTIN